MLFGMVRTLNSPSDVSMGYDNRKTPPSLWSNVAGCGGYGIPICLSVFLDGIIRAPMSAWRYPNGPKIPSMSSPKARMHLGTVPCANVFFSTSGISL